MERDPLRVSAVLGDPTRFAIYQYVTKGRTAPVTASEVAQQFSLHPNVARMHLHKLADVGLLAAGPEKGGRGRPGMAYGPSGRAINLTFPRRDYQLLSELLCEAVSTLGSAGMALLSDVGRAYGRQLGVSALAEAGIDPARAEVEDILAISIQALEKRGMEPEVVRLPDGRASLTLRNCGFHEVATRHPHLLCHLCREIVQGVVEAYLDVTGVRGIASLPQGDRHCVYMVDQVTIAGTRLEE